MGRDLLTDAKNVVLIDGRRFLQVLGLRDNDSLTPEIVRDALMGLSEEELEELGLKIIIPEPEPFSHLCFDLPEPKIYVPVEDELDCLTSSDLKKQIKHEKNPMRKMQLQKQLSSMNAWNGKHSKGKR